MNNTDPSRGLFTISRRDWSSNRQGETDQVRHSKRVRQAIKDALPEIISNQDIITSDGSKTVRVPIRGVKEYRFRHGRPQNGGSGQGSGPPAGPAQPGQGQPGSAGAGEDLGEEYYETDITIEELQRMVLEDLSLPNLQPKPQQEMKVEDIRYTDRRRKGPMSNLLKRETLMANMRRNAALGNPQIANIHNDDLRFRTWRDHTKPQAGAVIIAKMDVSGSMGEYEKYIARSFFWWMKVFLRSKYTNVEIVFISHHTEAKEVTEHEFFHRGESGGTKASSAYQLALEIIDQRYPPDRWNIYPFHISDGDNYASDNDRCVELVEQLLERSNMVGYAQIAHSWASMVPNSGSESGLYAALSRINHPQFTQVKISGKEDVYPALLEFFAEPSTSYA